MEKKNNNKKNFHSHLKFHFIGFIPSSAEAKD